LLPKQTKQGRFGYALIEALPAFFRGFGVPSGTEKCNTLSQTLKKRFQRPTQQYQSYSKRYSFSVVLVFGTICIDRLRRISAMPKTGGYCSILEQDEFLGGEAANTACFLVMWRQEVALAGNSVGAGFEGENLRFKLLEKGLDVNLLPKHGTTPVCDVYVDDEGDRTMFGLGFTDVGQHTSFDQLPLKSGHWFTADPNMSKTSREAIRYAHDAGMNLYLMDFFREDEFVPPGTICQHGTDWVGERDNPAANKEWVRNWTEKYQCITILTDGPYGAYLGQPGLEVIHLPPFPSDKMVDSTGAGDAFRAGVLYGLTHMWSIGHACRFGAASAAIKVQHLGATEVIPSLHEIRHFIHENERISQAYDF
jgi:sugar/nucleoside kinase (ribokinase family)